MARRRMAKVNTRLIMDVVVASLIVQKAPQLLSAIIPMDATIEKVAGAGAGFLTGVMFKRPDISNASLALAVADFANPLIDSVLGVGNVLPMSVPKGIKDVKWMPPVKQVNPGNVNMADYLTLNDYIDNPGNRQTVKNYGDAY